VRTLLDRFMLSAINEKPHPVRRWGSVEQPSPEVCS
jgi:hypothetical protein